MAVINCHISLIDYVEFFKLISFWWLNEDTHLIPERFRISGYIRTHISYLQ